MGRKPIDETNNRYGKLTVLREKGRDKHGFVLWLCKCDCGTDVIVSGHNLRSGNTKSCKDQEKRAMRDPLSRKTNEVGNRYGRLIVLKEAGKNKSGSILWLCKCDCGANTVVSGGNLRGGSTKSCGCLNKEKARNLPSNKINEMGNRYGRLVVLKGAGTSKEGQALWLCKCDCGNFITARGVSLRAGVTRNCGCLRREEREFKKMKKEKERRTHSKALPEGTAAFNSLLKIMKENAKRRQLEWSLSDEQVKKLIVQPCFYCGAPPRAHAYFKKLNGDFPCNGLDRIDNNRGYIENNVVSCCKNCNRAKGTMSFSEYKQFINGVFKHLSNIESV